MRGWGTSVLVLLSCDLECEVMSVLLVMSVLFQSTTTKTKMPFSN